MNQSFSILNSQVGVILIDGPRAIMTMLLVFGQVRPKFPTASKVEDPNF